MEVQTQSKLCRTCEEVKSSDDFYSATGKSECRSSECKSCYNESLSRRRKHTKENPLPDNHQCPICLRTEEDIRAEGRYLNVSAFAIDHCHSSGDMRGWICRPCNQGIGNLGDDVDRLSRAIEYIARRGL